ncbi:hypothetical protein T265_07769 [Opisthorchis viverrini]|uniref:Uncharacterized protein n=1 Tax=Opisthorchis viverrini TaxID=6198 RepID=A0A074ZG46_OPIVI|nr:hypothetical protein T265_07769 [Opisthorchis viverrini]KER24627.1 hypothetical protein T265_07769 [Opisthorchis viverrini]
MLHKSTQAKKNYPPNRALMVSPRMVAKRLQVICHSRRTESNHPRIFTTGSPKPVCYPNLMAHDQHKWLVPHWVRNTTDQSATTLRQNNATLTFEPLRTVRYAPRC